MAGGLFGSVVTNLDEIFQILSKTPVLSNCVYSAYFTLIELHSIELLPFICPIQDSIFSSLFEIPDGPSNPKTFYPVYVVHLLMACVSSYEAE